MVIIFISLIRMFKLGLDVFLNGLFIVLLVIVVLCILFFLFLKLFFFINFFVLFYVFFVLVIKMVRMKFEDKLFISRLIILGILKISLVVIGVMIVSREGNIILCCVFLVDICM